MIMGLRSDDLHDKNGSPWTLASPPPTTRVCRIRSGLVIALLVVALGAGCQPDQEKRLDQVRDLQTSGQLGQAVSTLREILSEDPAQPEANFMLGKAFLQSGQISLAIPALEKASKDPVYAHPAGILLASTLFQTRAFDAAIKAASRVLELDSDDAIALLTRGRAHLAAGHPQEALADANRILEQDPSNQNATRLEGGALIDLGRRDAAEKVWIDLRTRLSSEGSPEEAARACAQLALFYRTQDETEKADDTYRECLTHYPTNAYLQRWASDFYLRSGEPARAVALYQKAVEFAPDDLRLWARLASVLLSFGKRASAQKTLEETVSRFDSPAAWQLLADFHRKTGAASEARHALEEVIQRTPEPRQISLFSLADLLVEEGNLDRAREIGKSLTDPAYRHLLEGAIALRSNDPQEALDEIQSAIEVSPRNPRAWYLAGQAALATGDRTSAKSAFRKAFRFGKATTDAALRLAEIEFAHGRFRSAWSFARLQITGRPYSSPAPYRIAIRSAIELGDLESAKSMADSFHDADPNGIGWLIEKIEIARREGGAHAASEVALTNLSDLSDPANEPLLRGLVEDLNELGRAAEGLGYVDAAISRGTRQPALHDLRARVLSHLERFEEAEISAKRALELDPTYAPALEIEAFLALERGDSKAALAALRSAADAAPLRAQYSYAAASIAREIGDSALAVSLLEEAHAREPGFMPAVNDLAWLLADSGGDSDRALSLARRAVDQMRDANALDTLGWVQYQRGEYEDAVTTFRSALEISPDRSAVQYRLGSSLAAMGKTEEARAWITKALQGPTFPEIEKARAELERIEDH